MIEWMAVAASSDTAMNPLFFVAGGVALIVVSTLGPLARLHERRQQQRLETSAHKDRPTDS